MVTIEQIRLLDKKVHSAVERISMLKQENQSLKSKLEHYESRILELERLIESFKRDQGEIEQGITNALDELNRLEDDLDEESPAAEEKISQDDTHESAAQDSAASEEVHGDTDTQVGVGSEENEEVSPSPSKSIIQTQQSSDEELEEEPDEDDSRTGELDIF